MIRKAIRLTLLKPNRPRYRLFLNELVDIYRRGKAIAADKRLSEAGRRQRVEELVAAICDCTGARFADASTPKDEAERDFFKLTHEIVLLLGEEELFTYAIYPEAAGTNNESERELRDPAQDRVAGQTNKTVPGCRRRTVITSVLNSLQLHVKQFTLQTVLAELTRWQQAGISCFRHAVASLAIPPPSWTCWCLSRLANNSRDRQSQKRWHPLPQLTTAFRCAATASLLVAAAAASLLVAFVRIKIVRLFTLRTTNNSRQRHLMGPTLCDDFVVRAKRI